MNCPKLQRWERRRIHLEPKHHGSIKSQSLTDALISSISCLSPEKTCTKKHKTKQDSSKEFRVVKMANLSRIFWATKHIYLIQIVMKRTGWEWTFYGFEHQIKISKDFLKSQESMQNQNQNQIVLKGLGGWKLENSTAFFLILMKRTAW